MSGATREATHNAREEILGRVRAALAGEQASVSGSYAAVRREYQRVGTLDASGRLALFIDRLREYDTEVLELASEEEIAGAIAAVLTSAGEERVLVDSGLPHAWVRDLISTGVSVSVDGGLSTASIDEAQAVITTCEAAIAVTGTILLVHGGAQGRRIATLLPDHHICIVRREQIYETVSEAFAVLNPHDTRPVTTISGPSATSDIEMTRIRGVHGPRRLTVLLCG